jgi:(S)-ureidoglycine-glyoxylate aminotransferase
MPSHEIIPPARLLMGPGPINCDPRVLRALGSQMVGQFDPYFRQAMLDTMGLYRKVFETHNRWSLIIDGTARAAIEAVMVSLIEPGERVLVASFGRFGQLLHEIADRVGADVRLIETDWGTVFAPEQIEAALRLHQPKLLAICQGDTSTTMLQPLEEIGAMCRRHGVFLQVDATASIAGARLPVDAWQIDCVTVGLQKCLMGPPGAAPLTLSDAMAEAIYRRRHLEHGLRPLYYLPGAGPRISSNYFDLAMIMDYWSEQALNHHTEAAPMLYASRECARLFLDEGHEAVAERHAACGNALRAGVQAMGLSIYGDVAHKMPNVTGVIIPPGIDGEKVRQALLKVFNIEIGSSFGPLHGQIWRIGTMGYNARTDCVLTTLAAFETVLAAEGHKMTRGAGVDAAWQVLRHAELA